MKCNHGDEHAYLECIFISLLYASIEQKVI